MIVWIALVDSGFVDSKSDICDCFVLLYLTWFISFLRQEDRDVENSSSHLDISEKLARLSTNDATLTDWHLGFHISLVIALIMSQSLIYCDMELLSFPLKIVLALNGCSSFVCTGVMSHDLINEWDPLQFNIWSSYCPKLAAYQRFIQTISIICTLCFAGYAARIYTHACRRINSVCWQSCQGSTKSKSFLPVCGCCAPSNA